MSSKETVQESTDNETISETPGQDAETSTEAGEATREIGGRKGPDPTRYGDWEKAGRCIDF